LIGSTGKPLHTIHVLQGKYSKFNQFQVDGQHLSCACKIAVLFKHDLLLEEWGRGRPTRCQLACSGSLSNDTSRLQTKPTLF